MTLTDIKNQAKILKLVLEEEYAFVIKYGNALHIVAKIHGHKDWKVLSARLKKAYLEEHGNDTNT